MHTFKFLTAIAYRRDLVASRRLAIHGNLTIDAALRQILQSSAGNGSLDELVTSRQRDTTEQQARCDARKKQQSEHRIRKAALELPEPDRWQAWFDGACHPNPGQMGIGALLQSPLNVKTEISMMAGSGDSSEAEYHALIAVLQAASAARVQKLIIYGDSRVVLDDVQSSELQGSGVLRLLRIHAQQLLATIPDLKLRWIPRARNTAADALSQAAICKSNVPAPLPRDSAS